MSTPEPSRSYAKRALEEGSDLKRERDGDRGGDDEDWESSERRKHRSSRSRKHNNAEETEEWDSGSKRKSTTDRNDSKKKSGVLSRAGSGDDDDYDARKELRSKLVKRSQDLDEHGSRGNSGEKQDRNEKKSSSGYQEAENSRKTRDLAGSKGHSRLEEDRARRHDEKISVDEIERSSSRKTNQKSSSGHENSQSKSRSKSDNFREGELEKMQDKLMRREPEDLRYLERKESGRDKAQGTRAGRQEKDEQERIPQRKWDESDSIKKTSFVGNDGYLDKADSRSGKASDKPGPSRERALDTRLLDSRDISPRSKSRPADSNNEKSKGRPETREVKSVRSSSREERKVEGERSKNRGRSETRDEDNNGTRLITTSCEDRLDGSRDDKQRRPREKFVGVGEDLESSAHRPSSKAHGEKGEKHRQQRDLAHGGRDGGESWERSVYTDDDGHVERGRLRDRRDSNWEEFENGGRSGGSTRSGKEVRHAKRSRSPEGSGRNHRPGSEEFDRGFSVERAESDNERSISLKGKDKERGVYRDDSTKGRDIGWSSRSRDWEASKDHWKKRHHGRHDKDAKDGDGDFDYDKDWDSQRRDRERMDSEQVHGRSGYRKERSRTEGMKNSLSFGTANEKSDMIEIRTKSLDYGREESVLGYGGRRIDGGLQPDFTSGTSDEDWAYLPEDRTRMVDMYGVGDDLQERYADDGSPMLDLNMAMGSGRTNLDANMGGRGRGQKVAMNVNRMGAIQTNNGLQPPFGNNQGSGSFGRVVQQAGKVGRLGRGGRGRLTARDGQRVVSPLPIMGPPFGHLGLPPGPLQPIGPNMSPAPVPPIGPGFLPPFGGPFVWPGPRGVDMNMLGVPPGLSPVPPPGPSGPRFAPNLGTGPNPALYFNQLGPGRGASPSMSGPAFSNATGPPGRGMPHDKNPMAWGPPRISGPPGKAPSRGEQNDYSQNFVDTGMRPQNFIRELELTNVVEDYPKLRELIQKKDEIVAKSASPPMYYKCDLHEHELSPEFFGTKFDVILVDPPWEEYVHRAPGVADHMECWTFEEIQNLKIEAIADTPSFIFLWVGDGAGLEQGRQCLKKWGFRRCEDICWVKTNKSNATPGLRHDSHTLFQHSKEHCLMGIKGTVRRSTDGHIIHANIDTDIIIAEEPPYGSTTKPEDLYRIIEHFSLGRRRIELFGEDHNIRSGWLTVGKGLTSSNFNTEAYCKNFADKDGKVWVGGGGRNPPPDAPHLVVTTPDIEGLRPKSPPAKSQQQQSTPLSQNTVNNLNKRPAGNSPQNPAAPPVLGLNQEVNSSNNPQAAVPWASASPAGLKGLEAENASDDKFFDNYGVNSSCGQVCGDHLEFESHRAVNLL